MHTQTESIVGAWTPESQRHPLIKSAASSVSDDCLCGSLVHCHPHSHLSEASSHVHVSGQRRIQVCTPLPSTNTKEHMPLINIQQLPSLSKISRLYQFLVQTMAPEGCEVWGHKAVVGTVTQRSLKFWVELVFCKGSDVRYGVRM